MNGSIIINTCQSTTPRGTPTFSQCLRTYSGHFGKCASQVQTFLLSFPFTLSRTELIALFMPTFCDFYGMKFDNSGWPRIHLFNYLFSHSTRMSDARHFSTLVIEQRWSPRLGGKRQQYKKNWM